MPALSGAAATELGIGAGRAGAVGLAAAADVPAALSQPPEYQAQLTPCVGQAVTDVQGVTRVVDERHLGAERAASAGMAAAIVLTA